MSRAFGKIMDLGKRAFHKVAGAYTKARSFGKNLAESARDRYPSLFHAGLEAIYNSPIGDKVRGAEEIMRNLDSLAMGDSQKKVDAIKSLGRMALRRDISLAGEATGLAEEGLRFLSTQGERAGIGGLVGMATPAIRSQLMRGVQRIRELEGEGGQMA
jgi:hypothetical protein